MEKVHCTHRDLDRHLLVDAMLVVEVDAVDAEPLEAALARRPHICWVTADLPLAVSEGDGKLGGQLDLLSYPALKRLLRNHKHYIKHLLCELENGQRNRYQQGSKTDLAQKDLVSVRAVHVGGVEEGDPGGATAWWMSLIMSGSGLGGP